VVGKLMAPPTPILNRQEIEQKFKDKLTNCSIKTLKQFECFNEQQEIICIPFLRTFKQCLLTGTNKKILIETTTSQTNHEDDQNIDPSAG
jgi:hypothetical protein